MNKVKGERNRLIFQVREDTLSKLQEKVEGMRKPEKRGTYGRNDYLHIQSNIGYNEALIDLLALIKEINK